ncbi:MAG: glycosyltransferase family 39 protein [Candidatus Omnitrophica bacterium]|nr:glycosyltransferase family 39 protein [Candidatus Omnitrophota bacterium]
MKTDKNMFALLGVMAVIGAGLVYWMTGPQGLGLDTDSIFYLQAAKNVALGLGVSAYSKAGNLASLAWYPPGFPVFLSSGWFLGIGFQDWARLCNSIFFGASVFLSGFFVFYVTKSWRPAFVAAGLFLTSVHFLDVHARLLAEPLFLAVLLGFFLALAMFIDTGRRRAFYTAALLAGLSVFVRYGGIVCILAGAAAIIRSKREKAFRETVFFLLVSMALPLLLSLRNVLLTDHVFGGMIGHAAVSFEKVKIGIDTISEWILPASVTFMVRWAVFAGVIMIGGLWWQRRKVMMSSEILRVMGCLAGFMTVYLGSCVVVMFTAHASSLDMDHRILLPVYAAGALLVAIAVHTAESLPASERRILAAVITIFFVMGAARSAHLWSRFHREGYGYTSKVFSSLETVKALRSIEDHVPLYSNDPAAVYYLTGRSAVKIPKVGEGVGYFPAMPVVFKDFRNDRAVAVIFGASGFVAHARWENAATAVPLSILMKDPGAVIYGFKRK